MPVPEGRSAEFHGFFAVAGRTSSFIGPTVFGLSQHALLSGTKTRELAELDAEQVGFRIVVLSILAFLLVEGLLLLLVNERAGRKAAGRT